MNVEQFREYLIKRDQETLEERVERGMQLPPSAYNQTLPGLIWDYITEARQMFTDGYFIGVILLCAGMVELSLADQLMSKIRMVGEEIERFSLEAMTILAHRLEIVTDKEKNTIDELRKLRNALIHANAGKIAQMARRRWPDLPEWCYLGPFEGTGVSGDALRHLQFTKDLTLKFYGAEE